MAGKPFPKCVAKKERLGCPPTWSDLLVDLDPDERSKPLSFYHSTKTTPEEEFAPLNGVIFYRL
jgi:hypothetical protein